MNVPEKSSESIESVESMHSIRVIRSLARFQKANHETHESHETRIYTPRLCTKEDYSKDSLDLTDSIDSTDYGIRTILPKALLSMTW